MDEYMTEKISRSWRPRCCYFCKFFLLQNTTESSRIIYRRNNVINSRTSKRKTVKSGHLKAARVGSTLSCEANEVVRRSRWSSCCDLCARSGTLDDKSSKPYIATAICARTVYSDSYLRKKWSPGRQLSSSSKPYITAAPRNHIALWQQKGPRTTADSAVHFQQVSWNHSLVMFSFAIYNGPPNATEIPIFSDIDRLKFL